MQLVNNAIIFTETNTEQQNSENRFDTAVNENFNFDYTQTDTIQNNLDNNLDLRTQNALQRLSENIVKKGIRVKKNAIMLVSDISNNTMMVTQNGKIIAEIKPIVFSNRGIGNEVGSQKTPTGSFIIKEKGKRALQRANNVTGYFFHMAGIENTNANSYARGIGIHGMPTDDAGIANEGTTTYGCTAMTNKNIQKLYTLTRGKQTFVETIA